MADAIVQVSNESDVLARLSALESRFAPQRFMQRELDPWRHMDMRLTEAEIWRNVPENARRRTIMKPDIASVTNTLVAFLSGRRPKVRTRPKNPLALKQIDRANANERVGLALFDTIDRIGPSSLLAQMAESVVHRGELVIRVLWLSPEERGEERETLEPDPNVIEITGEPPAPEEIITKEGRFPLLVQVLDPVECSYTLGQDDRLVEFVHRYWTTWSGVADAFPGIRDKDTFRNRFNISSLDTAVEVIDYWTEDEHCILVDRAVYQEPTPHHYPRIPVIVEQVNPRPVQVNDTVTQRMGTPFCWPMLEPTRHLSWADSMLATYLEEANFSTIKLRGINPDRSPYMVKDPKGGPPQFQFALGLGPGNRVVPLFESEDLEYMTTPPIVAPMQDFRQSRSRDSSLTSFPESILSGAQTMDISGYAFSQMKQAAMARVEPPRMSMDRGASRTMTLCNDIIVAWWDLGDVPLVLTELVTTKDGLDTQTVELTKEDFLSVASIEVTIDPEVPINEEQEKTLIFQAHSQGLMSDLTAIERLGYVQDASAEIERVTFEQVAKQNPQIQLAVALKYMKNNDIEPAPQPAQAAAPGVAPGPASPPSPSPFPPAASPAGPAAGVPSPASAVGPGGPPIDPAMIAQAKQQFPQLANLPDEQVAQIIMQAMQQQQQQPMAAGA